MRAAVIESIGAPLAIVDANVPEPGAGEVLISTRFCGVCRTDLHIADGDLRPRRLPVIPGHQVVGTVECTGGGVSGFMPGDVVGVPWLGWTCGDCGFCVSGQENLCDEAKFTGYDLNGGFAEYCVADARYCFPIPSGLDQQSAAPLLCAGLIGYRAMSMIGDAGAIGFYGFGSSAHLMIQVARHEGRRVYAFTRRESAESRRFAMKMGASWAGVSDEVSPEPLDAAIIFAPAGELLPAALENVRKGGTVVCAGIHMSDIPSFSYSRLWGERIVRSVANLTRKDGAEFLSLAAKIPVVVETVRYEPEQINQAFDDLRKGRLQGSAVIDFR